MSLDIDVNRLNVSDLPLLAKGLQEDSVGLYRGHLVSKQDKPSLASPTYRQLDAIVRKAEELRYTDKKSLDVIRKYADRSREVSREKGKVAQFFESLSNVLGNTFK
ncbi:MAG: hypothetical protein JSR37_09095 [Verrucomicrobia bacterium]|nr:hypothetical protein [Verrucomicrobiota bacterium]MBS0637360.1 hypothetical protein [Verrucomicrobiota bacterium]